MTRAQRRHIDGPHSEPPGDMKLAVVSAVSLILGGVIVCAIYWWLGPPPGGMTP